MAGRLGNSPGQACGGGAAALPGSNLQRNPGAFRPTLAVGGYVDGPRAAGGSRTQADVQFDTPPGVHVVGLTTNPQP